MARRQFKTAFAATGDKVSIPDAVQPDGSVSLQEGYGFDYQRDPQSDPLAKVFPRDVQNGILNEITASLGEIQQQGYAIWTVAGAPYMINAVVRHNDQNWQSNIANNSDQPGVGAGATSWKPAGSSIERFNATVVSVASAATVNLNTAAPDTSHIEITGTAVITEFAVSAGRAFVVKFTGACTLSNSASLITQRGASITTAAGDTCLIRATAANVVEVTLYTPGIPQSVGYAQTRQNVTASRTAGTTYTNNTGRPIEVIISLDNNAISRYLVVNGVNVARFTSISSGTISSVVTHTILAGESYSVSGWSALWSWYEIR